MNTKKNAVSCRLLAGAAIYGLGLTAVTPGAAPAQDAGPGKLEEIVVTAQKVSERVSKTPVTVSALSGDDLKDRDYLSLDDFKGSIPGLQVNNYIGEARINIRGIGQNSLSFGVDPQVAYSLNGVFLAQGFTADEAFLDVDRVEVLRGPQGTLYGRNATGGAVNLITKRPTNDYEASAELTVGNYSNVGSQVVLSGPIVKDAVLARLAFSTEDHDGYSLNLYDGRHYDDANTWTGRGTLLFKLTDNLTLTLIGDYHNEDDGNYATHLFGKSPGYPTITGVVLGGTTVPLNAAGQAINPRLLDINTAPENKQSAGGATADLTWDANDWLTIKSITGFRENSVSLTMDFDSTPVVFPTPAGKDFAGYNGSQQVSQELQVIGDTDRIKWVGGLFYFHDKVDPAYFWLGANFGAITAPFLGALRLGGNSATDAYAAFGQATYHVTDALDATVGLRYSYEERSANLAEQLPVFGVNEAVSSATSFHDLSPKFTVDYQFDDGLMAYITIAKGFQSGGYDLSASPPLTPYQPETVWDYEAGIKFKNDWAYAALSGFHYDYSNLQVAQIVNGLPTTTNAASSSINGAEIETSFQPAPGFTISPTFAYLDAHFDKFTENDTLTGALDNLAGNQLPGSAKLATNVAVKYDLPVSYGDLAFFGEWNWHSTIYFTEFNSTQVAQPPTSTFNASARFTHDNWYVEAYGKNLTDRLIAVSKWVTGAGFGSMVLGQLAPPRTYGVTLHYSFP